MGRTAQPCPDETVLPRFLSGVKTGSPFADGTGAGECGGGKPAPAFVPLVNDPEELVRVNACDSLGSSKAQRPISC